MVLVKHHLAPHPVAGYSSCSLLLPCLLTCRMNEWHSTHILRLCSGPYLTMCGVVRAPENGNLQSRSEFERQVDHEIFSGPRLPFISGARKGHGGLGTTLCCGAMRGEADTSPQVGEIQMPSGSIQGGPRSVLRACFLCQQCSSLRML